MKLEPELRLSLRLAKGAVFPGFHVLELCFSGDELALQCIELLFVKEASLALEFILRGGDVESPKLLLQLEGERADLLTFDALSRLERLCC